MLTGCTKGSSLYIPCTSGVHPVYTAHGGRELPRLKAMKPCFVGRPSGATAAGTCSSLTPYLTLQEWLVGLGHNPFPLTPREGEHHRPLCGTPKVLRFVVRLGFESLSPRGPKVYPALIEGWPGLSIPQESARIQGEFWPLGLLMSRRVYAVPRGPWQFGTNPPRMGGGAGARVPLLPPSRT